MASSKWDDNNASAELAEGFAQAFEDLCDGELEQVTIEAIREYRRQLALAELADQEWLRAQEQTDLCEKRREELRLAHMRTQTAHQAYQLVVSHLIERLGFIPKVPSEKKPN